MKIIGLSIPSEIAEKLRAMGHEICEVDGFPQLRERITKEPELARAVLIVDIDQSPAWLKVPIVIRHLKFEGPILGIVGTRHGFSSTSEDEVVFLEHGGDRLFTMSVSARLLAQYAKNMVARMKPASQGPELVFGGGRLRVQLEKRQLLVDGKVVSLALGEFEVLARLARHPGTVFSCQQLEPKERTGRNKVLGNEKHPAVSSVKRIRAAIRAVAPGLESEIKSVYGVGYLVDP